MICAGHPAVRYGLEDRVSGPCRMRNLAPTKAAQPVFSLQDRLKNYKGPKAGCVDPGQLSGAILSAPMVTAATARGTVRPRTLNLATQGRRCVPGNYRRSGTRPRRPDAIACDQRPQGIGKTDAGGMYAFQDTGGSSRSPRRRMCRARTPRPSDERLGAPWRWLGRSDHILRLSGAGFANPRDRASKAPHDPSGRIFECNSRFEGHLRQLTKHAPTEPAPGRGYDARTVAFLPFHREVTAVCLFQAPCNVDAARVG